VQGGPAFSPLPALSIRITTMPCFASSSASNFPEPLCAARSFEFQLRSVGPLPARSTSAGHGPASVGATIVPGTVHVPPVSVMSSDFVASAVAGSTALPVMPFGAAFMARTWPITRGVRP
jgi:hypothetical protein